MHSAEALLVHSLPFDWVQPNSKNVDSKHWARQCAGLPAPHNHDLSNSVSQELMTEGEFRMQEIHVTGAVSNPWNPQDKENTEVWKSDPQVKWGWPLLRHWLLFYVLKSLKIQSKVFMKIEVDEEETGAWGKCKTFKFWHLKKAVKHLIHLGVISTVMKATTEVNITGEKKWEPRIAPARKAREVRKGPTK